jgi:glutathione S-transferase
MILIGQYDSPFVRRVAIAMRLQAIAFEHRPWSVFRDAEKIARYNPLMRVPTLVLEGGEVLIESSAILDALEDLSGNDAVMMPADAGDRRKALKVCSLATGFCDKAVSLVYETVIHKRGTPAWVERCTSQISGALSDLERSRAAHTTPWWFGSEIGYADITVACALRFLGDAHPALFDLSEGWPMLAMHAAKCEAMPVFQDIQQPFHVAVPSA